MQDAMDPIELRSLTLAEGRVLRQVAQRHAFVVSAWRAFAIFGFVGSLGMVGVRCTAGPTELGPKAVVVTVAAVLALLLLKSLEGAARPLRARLRADLSDELAQLETIDAVEALWIDEAASVGPRYALVLADGRVLFLGGPYLRGREHDFPSTRFSLARAPRSRIPLGVESLGDRLQPSGKLLGDSWEWDNERGGFPGDGEILEVDPASLRRRLAPNTPEARLGAPRGDG